MRQDSPGYQVFSPLGIEEVGIAMTERAMGLFDRFED